MAKPAIQKGFLAASAGLSSSTGGSSKKRAKQKSSKAKPSAADVFATPGVGARVVGGTGLAANTCLSKEARMRLAQRQKGDILDYSRFDGIGAKEQAKADREAKLAHVPAPLRQRLGKEGEDMVLEMAEKMKENPELRPTPEAIEMELKKDKRMQKVAKERSLLAAAGGSTQSTGASGERVHISDKIRSTRSDFKTRMEEMEAQKAALEQQSKRLERMARGDQESAQELVSFLMEQGMTTEEVEEMMTNPDEAGMEKLKLAMEKAFDPEQFDSVFQNADRARVDVDKVDELSEQLEGFKAEEDDVEEFDTPGAEALKATNTLRPHRSAKDEGVVRTLTPEAARIKREMEAAEREMARLRSEADKQHQAAQLAAKELKQSRRALQEAQAAKTQASQELDATVDRFRESEDAADVAKAGDIANAKAKINAEANSTAASTSSHTQPKSAGPSAPIRGGGGIAGGGRGAPVPEYEIVTQGSRHVGWVLKATVSLPLVATFTDVDLELTPTQMSVKCAGGTYAALEVSLPHAVDADHAKAKFTKKKKQLRLELRILPGELPEDGGEEM